jgi:hypothetical protein
MKTLIIIPCSKRKLPYGIAAMPPSFFDGLPALVAARAIRRAANLQAIPNNLFRTAWDRYDGQLYRRLKRHQPLINSLLEKGCLEIVIISGLYGVLNYDSPTEYYDLAINANGGVAFWGNNNHISNAIIGFNTVHTFDEVHTFLTPRNYYPAAIGNNGFLQHIQHWPVGLHGANNVNNAVAAMIINQLNLIQHDCK